jgi:hypothetical protein
LRWSPSDSEQDYIRKAVAARRPTPEIALALKVDPNRVSNWLSRHNVTRKRVPPQLEAPPPPDPVQAEQERLARQRQLAGERELLRAVAGEKSLRACLESLVRETAQRFDPPPKYKVPSAVPGAVEETLVLMLSDWHAYEEVKAERVRGFNEYNAATFGRRVKRVVDAAISIKQRMERGKGWRFPRLVIGENGDLISGTIHELERHSDAPGVVHAMYGCARVLAQAIRDLSAHFADVDVFCTPGNHGRFGDAKRIQQKDPWRSWDTLIALFARESLADCPNITWHIPDAYSVAFDIYGWRFLQTHGHDVKSWNSIPWYGLNRLVGNINALESARGSVISHYLFGHFHTAASLPHAAGESFINGSLIGANEFAINALGKADRPCQWLLGVHPEHGVTHRWPLVALADPMAPGYNVKPWEKAA